MQNFKTLDDINPAGQRVLVRVDLNVPMQDGRVTDDTRIKSVAPTIKELSDKGAKIILLAHFGRPKGQFVPELSLKAVIPALEKALGQKVAFAADEGALDIEDDLNSLSNGDILLLENIRIYPGEEKNDASFSKKLASFADLYVNDGFSVSHRAHASTEGLAHHLPAFAGRSMQAELEALENALGAPKTPVAAIVGGAKVSTKLSVLTHLVEKVDMLIIGGGMANTFLAAQGKPMGKSLHEADLIDTAKNVFDLAEKNDCEIILPIDVVMATDFAENAPNRSGDIDTIESNEMVLDIGEQTIEAIINKLNDCATLIWNGPFGAFEMKPFDNGTITIAKTIAALCKEDKLVAVGGGGDTVAALNQAGVSQDMTYISTAGGAFLEWMEGKELPGVKALLK